MTADKPFVLIIDDDPTHCKLMGLIADHISIRPFITTNARDGLEAVQNHEFDLILMDWRMPETDGCECTKDIRRFEKIAGTHTPIIGVTAKVMPGDKEQCLESGMDDYLAKPFTLEEITSMIAKWTAGPGSEAVDACDLIEQ